MFVAMDGRKVRALREERGMSRRDLAGAAGLGESTVRKVEAGANVRLRTVRGLAATLGTRPQELGRAVSERS
jgi:transcriptional regulator with XRE-family HTH domain